ncbi:hypothetical protein [Orrella marina]|uniref:hypothetical protein n=1 Tax=Orrella marina TaxID=2163011 RepID=UPI00131EF428|nr:hypothetical protein [Orrella marina]
MLDTSMCEEIALDNAMLPSFDERTQNQTLDRTQPQLPLRPDSMRMNDGPVNSSVEPFTVYASPE